jgi:AraC family transcriptional regulator
MNNRLATPSTAASETPPGSTLPALRGLGYFNAVPEPSFIQAVYGDTDQRRLSGYLHRPPDYAHSPNCCADNIIHLALAGNGKLVRRSEGRQQEAVIRSGQITISPAYERYNWSIAAIDVFCLDIHIPDTVLRATWQEHYPRHDGNINLNPVLGLHDPLLAAMMCTLHAHWQSSHPCRQLLIDGAADQVLVYLLGLHGCNVRVYRGGLAPHVLRRVKDYIECHLGESLSLDDLAAQASLSKFHFVRAFKQSHGTTPHSYVLERRLSRAAQMLETDSQSIIDIAGECGFADPAHFARVFRRKFGVGPRDFRRCTISGG